jgi:3-hydroxyisobutyrate dehydrogenase-like beta-hydroxyacid dehydrogenase
MRIGWIGLGDMGLGTAVKMAAAGFPVTGYDIRPIAPEAAPGVRLAVSPAEAAAGCDLLAIAVYSDDQVEGLLLGPEGLLPSLAAGTIVAIFTTGTIASIQKIAAAAPHGVSVLDTCFSRRHEFLTTGDMVLLVGGDGAALDRCRPFFAPFARETYHVGGTGAGRAIKLVNNLLFYAQFQMANDALGLAESLGLDRTLAAEMILKCTGASDAQNIFLLSDWRERRKVIDAFMVKDVAAALAVAREAKVDLGYLEPFVAAVTAQDRQRGRELQ